VSIIFRLEPSLDWKQLKDDPDLTVADMHRRMTAYPFEDCGFVGTMMDQLFGSPGIIVEAWDSDVDNFDGEFLNISVSWTYFHDRHPSRVAKIRIMEGEL